MTVKATKKDDFPSYVQGSLQVFLILPLIFTYLRNLYQLLLEKENKNR